MRKIREAIRWIGEWLFIIFVLLPVLLVLLIRWKKEMYDDECD